MFIYFITGLRVCFLAVRLFYNENFMFISQLSVCLVTGFHVHLFHNRTSCLFFNCSSVS